ncbi:Hypothetical predicted protein, partial [Pelobates cultripes]
MASDYSPYTQSLLPSHRPHQGTATDSLQRLEEIFLRFWEKRYQRKQAARNEQQNKPNT